MTTAFKHRPMSEILAQAPEAVAKDDAPAPAPTVDTPEVPEKYQGKTVEQVIEMHQNAEQALGRSQNEVGSLRGLVTDLSAVQRPASETVEQEPVNVSGEEILADPVDAVNRIVQPQLEAAEARRELDAADALFRTEGAALMARHGDIDAIVATTEFQQFASRTPSRQVDFNTAATGKGLDQVRAASRLLEDFEDFKAQAAPTTEKAPTPTEQARAVATERGGTGAPISSKPQIFESDVIALINSDVMKYRSPSYQKELLDAIKEKRFVKNT